MVRCLTKLSITCENIKSDDTLDRKTVLMLSNMKPKIRRYNLCLQVSYCVSELKIQLSLLVQYKSELQNHLFEL